MPLKPGDRIERYVIDALLGSGGMGEVYRAHDPRLKRAIALKILHPETSTDPTKASSPASGAGARMMREAQLAAALDHPNVVAVFDVGQIEQPEKLRGTTYLAMELIRGAPLRKFIGDASVRMKVRVRWLEEIARALGAAHAAGLVHRDVKPENVMIRDDGHVKVLDFGIAKRTIAAPVDPTSSTEGQTAPTQTAHGVVVGTPMYMAPEQLRAEPLDGRADQFAWGVVAYELITGKGLWSLEGGGYSLVAQILQAPPPSLTGVPGVTPRLAGAVARALAKDPEARFPNMTALLEELTGRVGADDTEPKIPVEGSSPDLARQKLSEAPTEYAKVADASAPVLPSASTQRSALDADRQSTTKRSAPPPRPPSSRPRIVLASVAALLAIAIALAVATGVAPHFRRAERPAAVPLAPSSALATGACVSNRACVEGHGGKPFICHRDDGACAALESEDCEVRADKRAIEAEDTVWIGTMFPLKGPQAEDFGRIETEGIELGQRDFAEVLNGMGAQTRPVGLVTCDDSADPARAAHHLAIDVRAPAVIGFGKNSEAVQLAESVFLPSHVLVMSSYNTSAMITAIPSPAGDPRLVWRSMFSTAQEAGPIAAFVSSVLEPKLRSPDRPHAALRVALVRTKNMSQLAVADALQRSLTFNGKPALLNGHDFSEVVVDDPFAPAAKPDFQGAVTQLVAFSPDIVIVATGDALAQTVLTPLEERWPARSRRPLYVVMETIPTDLTEYIGKHADRRRRFFGLTTVSTTTNNARLVAHFNETFHEKVDRTDTPNGSYDAFYVLAYASLGVPSGPLTGPALSRSIERLASPGRPVDVGPLAIVTGYSALAHGDGIDLEGTLGHLDFDPKTGEQPIDMAILCVGMARDGTASAGVESGLVYDARASVLKGEMACP